MAEERVFTPYDPDTGDRLSIKLSDADWKRHNNAYVGVYRVTDAETGNKYLCQRESCGLPGCKCDASAQLIYTMEKS